MNTIQTLSIALVTASLLGTSATAQNNALSRQQVKAELAAARTQGTLGVGGETNLRVRDLSPRMYPTPMGTSSVMSRHTVIAELERARLNGDLVRGESGLTEYEVAPHRYPARPRLAGKAREEVRQELAEARRLGDIVSGEQGRTLAEMFPQQYATVRAQDATAMKSRAAAQHAHRPVGSRN